MRGAPLPFGCERKRQPYSAHGQIFEGTVNDTNVRRDGFVDVDWLVKRGSHIAGHHILVLRMFCLAPDILVKRLAVTFPIRFAPSYCAHVHRTSEILSGPRQLGNRLAACSMTDRQLDVISDRDAPSIDASRISNRVLVPSEPIYWFLS